VFWLGTLLIIIGLVGLIGKAWSMLGDSSYVPHRFEARVVKTRLDTKKIDGAESYTYIATFFLNGLGRYESFEVSQKQFDVTIEKDTGILTCDLARKKFISWEVVKEE